MALEDIFRALEEQADRDVEVVLADARAHATVIREEAEKEAETLRAARLAEAERMAKSRSSQSLNQVRLEARKRLAGVKERAIREVFDDARVALGEVRSRPDYPAVFRALAEEALEGVAGEYELLVDPADADLARQLAAEKGLAPDAVRADISTAGGLVVATQGGQVMRRNTLEDRLEKFRGMAQAEVAEIVFV